MCAEGLQCALGVEEDHFSVRSVHLGGELSGHTERVGELGFACAELTEDLGDAHGFDAAAEQCVQVAAACGDFDHSLAKLHHFAACVKDPGGLPIEKFVHTHLHGATSLHDLVHLGFTESLHIDQIL